MASIQKEMLYQVHFGVNYETREYGWTTDLKAVNCQVDWQLLFSMTPSCSYQQGEFHIGNVSQRLALCRRCEAEGIGISAISPFSAGQLLSEKSLSLQKALTKVQYIQSALDKTGNTMAVSHTMTSTPNLRAYCLASTVTRLLVITTGVPSFPK